MTKAGAGRVLVAVIGSYLAFGLMVAGTEQLLSWATAGGTKQPAYLAADTLTQCLYLIATGYLCSLIARSRHRFAIGLLMMLGLLVGSFSLATSWKSEPHWYGIALLATYGPCLWAGWVLQRRIHHSN